MVFASSGGNSPLTAVMLPSLTNRRGGRTTFDDDDEKYRKHQLQKERTLKMFFATMAFLLLTSVIMVWYLHGGGDGEGSGIRSPHGEMLKKLKNRIAPMHDAKVLERKKSTASKNKRKRAKDRFAGQMMENGKPIEEIHDSPIIPEGYEGYN